MFLPFYDKADTIKTSTTKVIFQLYTATLWYRPRSPSANLALSSQFAFYYLCTCKSCEYIKNWIQI